MSQLTKSKVCNLSFRSRKETWLAGPKTLLEARLFLQWRNKRETEEGIEAFGDSWPGLEFTVKEVFLISRAGTLTPSLLPTIEAPAILLALATCFTLNEKIERSIQEYF